MHICSISGNLARDAEERKLGDSGWVAFKFTVVVDEWRYLPSEGKSDNDKEFFRVEVKTKAPGMIDYYRDRLKMGTPVTVHAKRRTQNYTVNGESRRGEIWEADSTTFVIHARARTEGGTDQDDDNHRPVPSLNDQRLNDPRTFGG